MKKIIQNLRNWWADRRFRRMVHQVAIIHHRAGVVGPYAAAAHEMHLRRKLEDFRDFASKRYLDDRTLTLDAIKQEWLDLVVKPMASSPFTREDAKCLKAAIVAITYAETFVGEARKARDADVKAALATARAGKVYTGRIACV
jgi:hypothetical protein